MGTDESPGACTSGTLPTPASDRPVVDPVPLVRLRVDPGESDPNRVDSDADGLLDVAVRGLRYLDAAQVAALDGPLPEPR